MRTSLLGFVLLALTGAFAAPTASAGPFASRAMGDVHLSFPLSAHAGGAFVGAFGQTRGERANGFGGEGFLEVHVIEFFTVGVVMRSQRLPTLATPLADRANTVRGRLRVRVPLVGQSRQRGMLVPLVSLGIDLGGGWFGNVAPGQENGIFALGGQLRLELVIAGRLTAYVPLGYDHLRFSGGGLRQFETGLGLMVRLGGKTEFGPRPRRYGIPGLSRAAWE